VKIEFNERQKQSLGAILFALNNARWLTEDGQPMLGKDAIKLNGHVSVVLSFYNEMNKKEKTDDKPAKAKQKLKQKEKITLQEKNEEVESANSTARS
jgi:hypothetical protein